MGLAQEGQSTGFFAAFGQSASTVVFKHPVVGSATPATTLGGTQTTCGTRNCLGAGALQRSAGGGWLDAGCAHSQNRTAQRPTPEPVGRKITALLNLGGRPKFGTHLIPKPMINLSNELDPERLPTAYLVA